MFGAYAGPPHRMENRNNLREVLTVFDVKKLNKAAGGGKICIIRPLRKNPELVLSSLLLRHRRYGHYAEAPSRKVYQQYGKNPDVYSEDEWDLIQKIDGYARAVRHESNWGAYIVPSDASINERFFIGELIEDLVASEFWYTVYPAESAEAVWNGTDLVIDPRSYRYELVG